jgi:hypothetical protein
MPRLTRMANSLRRLISPMSPIRDEQHPFATIVGRPNSLSLCFDTRPKPKRNPMMSSNIAVMAARNRNQGLPPCAADKGNPTTRRVHMTALKLKRSSPMHAPRIKQECAMLVANEKKGAENDGPLFVTLLGRSRCLELTGQDAVYDEDRRKQPTANAGGDDPQCNHAATLSRRRAM